MPLLDHEEPPPKRQRLSDPKASNPHRSRIFAPFRTIGLVSPTSVPFSSHAQGKTTVQLNTSVGRSIQTYDLRKGLHLVFISQPQTPGPITANEVHGDSVLAAWSSGETARGVWAYKRGKKAKELEVPLDLDEDIVELLVLGPWIVGCCSTRIEVWRSTSYEHYTTLLPPYSGYGPASGVLTGGICSLPTFTNKICAGRDDGSVEIWNVCTGKHLYTIQPPSSDSGPVSALQTTPALGLVAVAYICGDVIIYDVQADKRILKIRPGTGEMSPITCMSFRTDGFGAGEDGHEPGVMAVASYNGGDVVLWDLNGGGRKIGTLRNAHRGPSVAQSVQDGGISKVEFLTGQAVMVTSGLDNALRTWIFDSEPFSPIPRPLHSRSGHSAAITTLNFIPAESDGSDMTGKWLLSSSADQSLWGWSLRRDSQSSELSQGRVKKRAKSLGENVPREILKAPRITSLACCLNRDGGIGTLPGVTTLWASAKQMKGKSTATEQNITGWESVVTAHQGDRSARTWFWGRKRAGRWLLETGDRSEVTSVAISPCGTFALIGSALGGIDMYNLQSGLHRQRFPPKLNASQAKRVQLEGLADGKYQSLGKHTGMITGILVDNLNRTVISTGSDGKVKFWNFMTGKLSLEINWETFCKTQHLRYHRPSDLIAVACSDNYIRLIDIEMRALVRELGVRESITDLCFSNDGRWIVAASERTIRIWDLPTGHLVDAVKLQQAPTAIAFSNTGEYLAVALNGSVGIDLWTNRTLFTRVPTQQISEDTLHATEGPTASGEGGEAALASAFDDDEDIVAEPEAEPVEQLSKDVMSLSLVPRARWQTLLQLDLIRQRNKPKEPPKAPEKVPFFLPSLHTNHNQTPHVNGDTEPATNQIQTSRFIRSEGGTTSAFTTLLQDISSDHTPFIEHIKSLAPAAADLEIRSLRPVPSYTELAHFVDAMTRRLDEKRDYELVQAWMAVFLRCHGEVLQEAVRMSQNIDEAEQEDALHAADLIKAVKAWRNVQKREAQRLGNMVGYCTGVVGFLRSAR